MTAAEIVAARIRQLVAEAPPLPTAAVEHLRDLLPPVSSDGQLADPGRAA